MKNREIIEFFRDGNNRESLEALLAKETEEWKPLLKYGSSGSRVPKKDIALVFAEAKNSVDSFLGINPTDYNPALDTASFLQGSIRPLLFYSGAALMGFAGAAMPPHEIFREVMGTVLLFAGAAGVLYTIGATVFGSRLVQIGEYNPEKNQILALRSRRNLFSYLLRHEYGHAITADRFREGNDYIGFREGFCMGLALMLQEEGEKERATALSLSIKRLELARKSFGRLDAIDRDISKGHPKRAINRLRYLGYSMFRLAEERHGADVYREVYDGNPGILFN